MWDWLSSKFAVILAVVIILGVVVVFFFTQQRAISNVELKNQGDKIAEEVNAMNTLNAQTSKLITFDTSKGDVHLKLTILNAPYNLRLGKDAVIVTQERRATFGTETVSSLSRFNADVHLWNPRNLLSDYITQKDVDNQDALNPSKCFTSSIDIEITLERKELHFLDQSQSLYLTFLYPNGDYPCK